MARRPQGSWFASRYSDPLFPCDVRDLHPVAPESQSGGSLRCPTSPWSCRESNPGLSDGPRAVFRRSTPFSPSYRTGESNPHPLVENQVTLPLVQCGARSGPSLPAYDLRHRQARPHRTPSGECGVRTRDLSADNRARYHCANPPVCLAVGKRSGLVARPPHPPRSIAPRRGIEPRLTVLETAVLPLDHLGLPAALSAETYTGPKTGGRIRTGDHGLRLLCQ